MPRITSTGVLSRLRTLRVVPVIVIDEPSNAAPLGAALVDAGLPCAEITFRTPNAAESIRRITGECPNMVVGAGTILTPDQAARARDAGAQFIVAPGFNPAVVDFCLGQGLAVNPGVCTPTEIEMALAKDLRVLKFFPAEAAGGLDYLKAVAAPYVGVEFMPTGGINAGNVRDYLAFKRVVACGGSWMAPAEWIAAKRFDQIRAETTRVVDIVRTMSDASATEGR
jgi:2-dehydro-3-deoxyphosphogluconate aldolase/(4S)-4-hydroxy-2-oxoglutarate aldolase